MASFVIIGLNHQRTIPSRTGFIIVPTEKIC